MAKKNIISLTDLPQGESMLSGKIVLHEDGGKITFELESEDVYVAGDYITIYGNEYYFTEEDDHFEGKILITDTLSLHLFGSFIICSNLNDIARADCGMSEDLQAIEDMCMTYLQWRANSGNWEFSIEPDEEA